MYYSAVGGGNLEPVSADDGIIPVTSMFTMSLEAADLNNDLRMDLFSTDMTFARSTKDDYCDAVVGVVDRSRCSAMVQAYEDFSSGSAVGCAQRNGPLEQRECYFAFSVKAAKDLKEPRYCENLPDSERALRSLCLHLASPIPLEEPINQDAFPSQVQRNVLLMNTGEGFSDLGQEAGVDSSFWSWNAKAADLDNDEWQDIYVGNGFHFGDSFYEVQPNVMFRNLGGERFERAEIDWGLDDTINTPSYTYLDLDLDGDLDIVSTGVLAPPRVFRNLLSANQSISIVLRDRQGNSGAIGGSVTIRYGGPEERFQRRDARLSGGFLSFDNPVLHFGLGTHERVDEITVRWPDGETDRYAGPFAAGRFYRISREVSSQ